MLKVFWALNMIGFTITKDIGRVSVKHVQDDSALLASHYQPLLLLVISPSGAACAESRLPLNVSFSLMWKRSVLDCSLRFIAFLERKTSHENSVFKLKELL